MVEEQSRLVMLVQLIDRLPMPARPPGRGRPRTFSDRVLLKALVIMIVRRLPTIHGLLAVLEQPTAEMQRLRELLMEHDRFPCRRTWERRMAALPETLP